MSANLNVIFYADCEYVACDENIAALSKWCKDIHDKQYLKWTMYSEAVINLKGIPEFLKVLKKTPLKLSAITLAAGHGSAGGGSMQVGNDSPVQAGHFDKLEAVAVPWADAANPVVYLNPCWCALGGNGLALCNAVGKYFLGNARQVTIIGPVTTVIGIPPPILSPADAKVRKVVYKKK